MNAEVLFFTNSNGVATILLNRPHVLNALSFQMVSAIKEQLVKWSYDDRVQVIILKGAGERGFCAGGDIKALYDARSSEAKLQQAEHFFQVEYAAILELTQCKKPIIACLDGIVMGGGVGLSYGARYKIVTERTQWAMPEMNIGFFPDVGAAYFLNRAPNFLGYYVALTAAVLQAADVFQLKAATHYISSDQLEQCLDAIEERNWHQEEVEAALATLIAQYTSQPPTSGFLQAEQEQIARHFSYPTMEGIIHSLEQADDAFAKATKKRLLEKSPLSLKVALKQLQMGEEQSLAEALQTDLFLVRNFLRQHDFYEGIRSVLIDKDRLPNYEYKDLADVSDELVERFFQDPVA